MRATTFLIVSSSLFFFGCGGGIAPSGTSGDGSGTDSSGTSGSSATSGGTAHSNPNMPTGGSSGTSGSTCTAGSYVFCRCDDGTEGTKECLPDRSFAACSCNDLPPPPPPCFYPATNNPPGCPATYAHVYQGQPCDTLNLQCWYPGQGDPESNGCNASALLACRVAPGGATFWTASQ
jgi:hypothetical protein